MSSTIPAHLQGLTAAQVAASQKKHGYNQASVARKSTALELLLAIVKEPMLLLLIAVAIIYVLVGNYDEALFMLGAIVLVSGISFYQDTRSKRALEAIERLNEPLSVVIREGKKQQIPTREIAVGDLCLIEEGKLINADGIIRYSSDFTVNESSLTGESFSVAKSADSTDSMVYSGTVVVSGLAVFQVTQIGTTTQLGKIGQSVEMIAQEKSPLHRQITAFVQRMAIGGSIVFLLVWGYNFIQTQNLLASLLAGLTLAMSVLPEEIPVAFTTFMALGAWKLMQHGIIIKQSSVVETLGSTTVICTDKTGTITENTMHLKLLYDFKSDAIYTEHDFENPQLAPLIQHAMWSSEPVPFDPMEKTLHQVYHATHAVDKRGLFTLVHEYPLEGKPPMMTHVFQNAAGDRIIAAKGAPEAILSVCKLTAVQLAELRARIESLGSEGYRVLGVAQSGFTGTAYLENQQDLPFEFLGFTVFYDPPKKGIQAVFEKIYQAGIRVKVITGDNAATTAAIAKQAGIRSNVAGVTGAEILQHTPEQLIALSKETVLFTRMFPEAKLAVVNALKADGEVVAMLGDGVNDAPALKAAHIGVAMGSKGTEIAKAAASLVIVNDDLDKLIEGIAAGRRIYANIKKAIQYIISIHIPIILTVSLPLFLGWKYPHIFTPVHVIFLELIMGPTCSIVYENEPMEKNSMLQKPRKMTDTFLNWRELSLSVLQGLVITLGVLFAYQYAVQGGQSEEQTRAMVFTTLLLSNILLCLVNRSFTDCVIDSFNNKNKLFPLIIGITLLLLGVILYVPAVADFFQVSSLQLKELTVAFGISVISVLWFEGYKWIKRRKRTTT